MVVAGTGEVGGGVNVRVAGAKGVNVSVGIGEAVMVGRGVLVSSMGCNGVIVAAALYVGRMNCEKGRGVGVACAGAAQAARIAESRK